MKLFDFFKRNKNSELIKADTTTPSAEQAAFAKTALEIIAPTVEKYGYIHHKTEIKTYSANIVWRKDKQYIKVNGSNYPTDYPFNYNIILGEGSSDEFLEYDWNSVALWTLSKIIEPTANISSYDFPFGDKIKFSLDAANKDLLKFGQTFLSGDLTTFYEARKMINEKREPYKIHKPNAEGKFETTDEPTSVEQKKKYS